MASCPGECRNSLIRTTIYIWDMHASSFEYFLHHPVTKSSHLTLTQCLLVLKFADRRRVSLVKWSNLDHQSHVHTLNSGQKWSKKGCWRREVSNLFCKICSRQTYNNILENRKIHLQFVQR